MAKLQDRLDRIRESFHESAPAEAIATIQAANQELEASKILDGVIRKGAALPPFALEDTAGVVHDSRALLQEGPLVLSIYRGVW